MAIIRIGNCMKASTAKTTTLSHAGARLSWGRSERIKSPQILGQPQPCTDDQHRNQGQRSSQRHVSDVPLVFIDPGAKKLTGRADQCWNDVITEGKAKGKNRPGRDARRRQRESHTEKGAGPGCTKVT